MSIRRQWVLMLAVMGILMIAIVATLLGVLIRQDFHNIMEESYDTHVAQVIQYTQSAIEKGLSSTEIAVVYESHIQDPISSIRLYKNEQLLVNSTIQSMMMGRHMQDQQTDVYYLQDSDYYLAIERTAGVDAWMLSASFRNVLLRDIAISTVVALIASWAFGLLISKRTSRELKALADYTRILGTEAAEPLPPSHIEELNTIKHAMNRLDRQLKIKKKFQKERMDEIKHQTKTPLAIIASHIEGINDGVLKPDKERLDHVLYQVDLLSDLLNEIKYIDKKEVLPLELETVKICELIQTISKGFQLECDAKGLALIVECDETAVQTDRYKLSQAMYNILSNAVKYTDEGSIHIRGRVVGEVYELLIADTGRGMKNIDQACEAYTKFQSQGEGLGLYIATQIMAQLKGSLQLTSTLNKGTVVSLKIALT